jgi:hypothetical protein
MVPGLFAPILRVVLWRCHLGALEMALALGVASVAGFLAVGTWAGFQLRAGRRADVIVEGAAQSYWVIICVCVVSAVLLTVKVAPVAFRVLAP